MVSHSYFTPLEKYDPIHDPDSMGEEQVLVFETSYITDPVEIGWQTT
jgi:hypothetical protein